MPWWYKLLQKSAQIKTSYKLKLITTTICYQITIMKTMQPFTKWSSGLLSVDYTINAVRNKIVHTLGYEKQWSIVMLTVFADR